MQIVRGHDHRHANILKPPEELHDLQPQVGVEIARGLIGNQQRRLADNRARDSNPLLLADRGTVAPLLIANTLIGATLMTAGANTLNCVADADIDKLMKRTADRPLARAAISSRHALVFGLALSVGSFLWLWWTTHLLAGLLALATIAFYAFVYTLLIKRRTSHNVVWGGAANGMPVMICTPSMNARMPPKVHK